MKKLILSMALIFLVTCTTGCSKNKELEQKITTLEKQNQELSAENKKLSADLQVYKDKEEAAKKEQEKIEEEKSKYKQIQLNENVVVQDYGEFTIKSAELKQKVVPPNPSSLYTYYEVKDPNEIYLDTVLVFKNTTTIGIGADEITNVKVIYGEGYEYDSFSAVERSGGTDFTYTNISNVEPLKSIKIHYLATLPLEVKDSDKPIKLQFSVGESQYELKVR